MTKWRKLDNSAKIFPIDSDKNFSAVYRMSVLLTEEIKHDLLKKAVDKTLESFTSFKVCLKRGFFWYYLEENTKEVLVDEEKNYPCKYIDKNTNNGYLFKVTYYKNKINVDTFHSLTDGSSSIEFIKAIAYNYIDLAHPEETKNIPEMEIKQNIEVNDKNTEDSYIKNYQKHLKLPKGGEKAYILHGRRIPLYGIGVVHGFINLKQIIKRCRKLKVTVTQYFTAVLIYAIYQEYIEKNKNKKSKKNNTAKNNEEKQKKSKLREAISFMTPIVVALIIAIFLKTCIFANIVIPTGSMLNTIQEGDRIIASRLAYINDEPQRYDIIIFKYPDDETQLFAKRIIALPGETIEVKNGIVYITDKNGNKSTARTDFITNCIPTGNFGPYTVPLGSYFVMGDNRNDSWDSRYWDNKTVKKGKIIGKVKFRYFPNPGKIE